MAAGHAVLQPAPGLAGAGVGDLDESRELGRAESAEALDDIRSHSTGRSPQLIRKVQVAPRRPIPQQRIDFSSKLIGQLPGDKVLMVPHVPGHSTPRATLPPETQKGKWQFLPLPLSFQLSVLELSELSEPNEPSEYRFTLKP